MSDDQNTTQNPISEETMPKDRQDSIPPSPKEPTVDAPIPATVSTPAEMSQRAKKTFLNIER